MAIRDKAELHRGKRGAKLEISISEEAHEFLIAKAHALDTTKADLAVELFYLGLTGETFSMHVAKDKAAAIKAIREELRVFSGSDGGAQ